MYRPEGWPENPCDGCENKIEDQWGLFCNIPCGKNTAWLNRESGADAILEGLKSKGIYRDNQPFDAPRNTGTWVFIPEE